MRLTLLVSIFLLAARLPASEPVPKLARDFFSQHCSDCHAGNDPEGNVRLQATEIDWLAAESISLWERVFRVLSRNEMPPADVDQPPEGESARIVQWLEDRLSQHAKPGGTVLRRLNRGEYENTIRDLFELSEFRVPDAFPADDSAHGFDSIGEALILSPPLLAQYLDVATSVADEILPPAVDRQEANATTFEIGADGLTAPQGAGAALVKDRFRLVSSRNMASAAGWPKRFEAPQSGVYRLSIDVTAFQTDKMSYSRRENPFRLGVYARQNAQQVYDPFGQLRKLAEFDVKADQKAPQSFSVEVELFRGEVFGLRWQDGPAYSDPPAREFSTTFLADRLKKNRRFYAAILKLNGGPRGITEEDFYQAVVDLMDSDELDMSDPRLNKMPKVWGGGLGNAPHNWIKSFVYQELYRFGPAVDVLDVQIIGPLRLIEDEEARQRKKRTEQFLGRREATDNDRQFVQAVLSRFLPRAFRRPVSDHDLENYVTLAMNHLNSEASARVEDGIHLAIRRALVSPRFLYRSALQPGRLDDFDLATRLSYFLTAAPADDQLMELARRGKLSERDVLRRETLRLLDSPRCENFVRRFTGQWLGTRLLSDIMPDPRLLKFFDPDREAMIAETELFLAEILRENHPIETFIDPGFSYRNENLNKIYGGKLSGRQMRRVTFDRGGRQGGIMGLASVMMATANGVDTHPVLRGVWVLENVFGTPPPSPPPNVPAIAPDTSGTTTIRAQLQAHRADASCARCHQQMDPLGMVLENFDPVGRWRENYPRYVQPTDGDEKLKKEFYSTLGEGTEKGPPVDAVGIMPDGTRLEDVTDLKAHVLERIDMFSRCLTEKLLVYATGRALGFADRQLASRIVDNVKGRGNGFRDLVVAVVLSEPFATN